MKRRENLLASTKINTHNKFLYCSLIIAIVTLLIGHPANNGKCEEKYYNIINVDKDIKLVSGRIIKSGEIIIKLFQQSVLDTKKQTVSTEDLYLSQDLGPKEKWESWNTDGAYYDGIKTLWSKIFDSPDKDNKGNVYKIVDILIIAGKYKIKRFYFDITSFKQN